MLLYTPQFFSATLIVPERFEVVLTGVKTVRFGEAVTGTVSAAAAGGNTPIATQTVVLSGLGTAADFLRAHAAPGTQITVRYDVSPALPDGVTQALAGGPRLVEDGKIALTDTAEGLGGAFSTGRNPRTAAGITADGTILLMTVEGRQPLLSRGRNPCGNCGTAFEGGRGARGQL